MICPYGLNGETRPVKIHSRRYLCGLFLSLPLFLAVARSAGSEDADPFPPASPGTETVVPGDLPFVTDCLSQVNEIAANNGWKLGTQLLTHSDQWGTILRVDFDIAGYTVSARINRAVCWRTAGGDLNIMYAIGQDVPALYRPLFGSIMAVVFLGKSFRIYHAVGA
jgi:hypothetical protein